MLQTLPQPAIDNVLLPLPMAGHVVVKMLRLDTVDRGMSGNKAYKLLPNIEHASAQGYDTLLSFGGAFSNHLHALALAGQTYQMKTVGVIRGEERTADNPTLRDCVAAGMACHFVSRQDYRRRDDTDYLAQWQARYPSAWIVPEGGGNDLGEQGCQYIGQQLRSQIQDDAQIVVAAGTGTTARGMYFGLNGVGEVHCVPVLKGLVVNPSSSSTRWFEWSAFHCGGYAKINPALLMFMNRFEALNSVELDPVYTAKMAWAASQLLDRGVLQAERLLLVHTGGVQGKRGMMAAMQAHGYANVTCT